MHYDKRQSTGLSRFLFILFFRGLAGVQYLYPHLHLRCNILHNIPSFSSQTKRWNSLMQNLEIEFPTHNGMLWCLETASHLDKPFTLNDRTQNLPLYYEWIFLYGSVCIALNTMSKCWSVLLLSGFWRHVSVTAWKCWTDMFGRVTKGLVNSET